MSYPLNESFETAPATGHTTAFGGMAATHNGAQLSLDLSAPNSPSILRFNEAAHGDFWFEAELELLTDSAARRYIGLWMTTGNDTEGFRFAHVDNAWTVTRWTSGFGDGTVVASLNEGARPFSDAVTVAPAFNVGQRMTLRCEVITGAFNASDVPLARLIQFKVNGAPLFLVNESACRGRLIPGVFLYGGTARVHAIAGSTPSGLPAFPVAVGVNDGEALMRLNSPSSDLWDQGGGYASHIRQMLQGRRNVHFGGTGFIAGTIKEKGQPNRPLVRRVQLIHDGSSTLVDETWSHASGAYRFESLDQSQRYTVISYDHMQIYRAVIADHLVPESMP